MLKLRDRLKAEFIAINGGIGRHEQTDLVSAEQQIFQ
jgi:hypothetical protein